MLSFLIERKLTDKERMLECIKKVYDWHMGSFKESSETSLKDSPQASTVTTKDLKLELGPTVAGQEAITTVEELDAFLTRSLKIATPKT